METISDSDKGKPAVAEGGKKTGLKLALFLVILAAIFGGAKYFGLAEYLTAEKVEALLDSMGIWAPIAFIAMYGVGMLLGLPGTIFTVAGGLAFGKWYGTFYNVIGASLGASGAFWMARLLASEAVKRKFSGQKWFRKFDKGLRENGLYYMLFVRLVPVFPFNGINFGAGLTSISFRHYFIGTAVGIVPATFVFTNAAAEGLKAAETGQYITGGTIAALALLGMFSLIPIIIKRRIEEKRSAP